MTTRPVRTRRPRASWWALVVDLALVLVFVLIGRSSHAEALDPLGVLTTTWPFAVGLVVGWASVLGVGWPPAGPRAGLVVWVSTVVVGVLLRVASGQGIEPSFVVVTAVVLGVLLVGWRLVAGLVGRRRGSGRSA
ncbi:hypothetical protein ASF17_01660 [Frigoribacterium sp. Leaf263]|uniref:DUF3054 domain-containing protein n=1 Tax=Frigoribacterium sp. Leaf263 TaxID=1736313 RepID=UPI0006FF34ED|nr:DUF3054 domain-containing protein [Frigoribacterium sp. Leaf263]KQO84259.1 hypothetical protein ASF17_01660 [Frigoribacterium sp. Leaf263]